MTGDALTIMTLPNPIDSSCLPGRVLVVDDDTLVRRFFTGVLERDGHGVMTAKDGKAALKATPVKDE